MINFSQFKHSFVCALRGIEITFAREQSFRLQIGAAVGVLALALFLDVKGNQLIVLVLLIGAVLVLEMLNTVLEGLIDSLKPRLHPMVRDIKDIMAGSVLIVSLLSVIIGFLILWDPLCQWVTFAFPALTRIL